MPLPWGEPYQIEKKCYHCGSILDRNATAVAECSCPEAEKERAADRERLNAFNATRKPTFAEACKKNKVPVR